MTVDSFLNGDFMDDSDADEQDDDDVRLFNESPTLYSQLTEIAKNLDGQWVRRI